MILYKTEGGREMGRGGERGTEGWGRKVGRKGGKEVDGGRGLK